MFILGNSFQTWCTIHAGDIVPTVNHANCLDQEPVRHTYGNLIYGIRLLLNPLFSSAAFHQDWKCAWGMLRQPCLNYSLTLWPWRCIDTVVQTGTIAPGRIWLHLCAQLLRDNVRQWNLNCSACARAVFVFSLTFKLRGSAVVFGSGRSSALHPEPPPTTTTPHRRWSPVSAPQTSSCKLTAYSNAGVGLMPFNSLGHLVLSGSL